MEPSLISESQEPHEAMFFVLPYLDLLELVMISQVCRPLRDAVENDVLLWQHIFVEGPSSSRIDDRVLLKITSKAQGRLRTLALMNCVRITDDGLQQVIENNPHIVKLFVPFCTQLTPDGIVRAVKRLTDLHEHNLKSIRLQDIHNITKEHLQTLCSCLGLNSDKQHQPPNIYLGFEHLRTFKRTDIDRAIDIGVCPKCNSLRTVFDCPRETCGKRGRWSPLSACRGCFHCISRCEECGGCNIFEEYEESACLDYLCLECWLRLPKCNLCNRPYCSRHACMSGNSNAGLGGFICEDCSAEIMDGRAFKCWRIYE
ncbi:hypothetical protein Sjap_024686 [Stephania japonica]|uniref:F-box domain-containing protein n=1 Tax=Stephania japonica TaxID=461633 RepID=A0AAP0EMH6_9MAGN